MREDMTEERLTARRGWIRAVLGLLGCAQLIIGIWALLAPRSFYGDFPTGQGWVAKAGAYDEHLVRDVGSLFIAIAVLALIAAVLLTRSVVVIACVVFLLYSVPHLIYHALNLGPYDTADAIGNVVALSAEVLAPAFVLWLVATAGARAPG